MTLSESRFFVRTGNRLTIHPVVTGSLAGKVVLIPVEDIKPNSFNPNMMPKQTYETMLQDMGCRGIDSINPVEVRPVEGCPHYELVDGQSRWAAARELGWRLIRAEIRLLSLEDAKAECYRKNRLRGHIDPFKEAALFRSEIESGLSYRDVAGKFEVSRGYVYESLRLLTGLHPDIVRRAQELSTRVDTGLTRTHLEVLASIKDRAQQRILFEKMVGAIRSGKPLMTSRELEVEKRKLTHATEPIDVSPGVLFQENVWPAEPQRDNGFGSSSFPGNCSAMVCRQSLYRYTKPNEIVLDPMAGSGTMVDVANALARRCIALDINPVRYRTDIIRADARELPLGDASVDFVFLHPPYWNLHRYSDPPLEGDLSAMRYDKFLAACNEVLCETFRVLRPGRFTVALSGDIRKELRLYDIPSEMSLLGRRVGLQLYDKIVKPIVRERSNSIRSQILASRCNFHLIKFETELVFRKPSELHQ